MEEGMCHFTPKTLSTATPRRNKTGSIPPDDSRCRQVRRLVSTVAHARRNRKHDVLPTHKPSPSLYSVHDLNKFLVVEGAAAIHVGIVRERADFGPRFEQARRAKKVLQRIDVN